jgi:hypothetical protein
MIEETAEDFLCEDQVYLKNRSRYDEIRKTYDEFVPAFRVLRDHIKDDKPLDGALRDVMWNSFLIGLACDRERLENPEILERYSSSVTGKARKSRKKKQDEWSESVYKAVCLAIPVAHETNKNFRRPARTTECADILFDNVLNQLVKLRLDEDSPRGARLEERTKEERENALKSRLEERLKPAAIRRALGRFIDENGKMDASARGVRRRTPPRVWTHKRSFPSV